MTKKLTIDKKTAIRLCKELWKDALTENLDKLDLLRRHPEIHKIASCPLCLYTMEKTKVGSSKTYIDCVLYCPLWTQLKHSCMTYPEYLIHPREFAQEVMKLK